MCDIADAKGNGVGIHAVVLEWQLLSIPSHPVQSSQVACSKTAHIAILKVSEPSGLRNPKLGPPRACGSSLVLAGFKPLTAQVFKGTSTENLASQ